MKLFSCVMSGLRDCHLFRPGSTRDVYLQVSNLTRNTVLASSMEVADSGAKRNKGLLGRERLVSGEGLWIIPCQAVHTFWMRFPIDLVYLDSKKRIRKLRGDVRPWRLSACFSAHSVLELPSGTIRDTGTEPGDIIEFSAASLTGDGSISQ